VSTLNFNNSKIRFDLQIIASWIEPNTRVLDLGCGEGALLDFLKRKKNVNGTGIEHNEAKVAQCIEQGCTVVQGDINQEVLDYADGTFDYVILSQTLQQVFEPATLIRSILRIGKKCVVSFPNFSHWRVRSQLLLSGYAPVTRQLPYQWYDTPNIRVITLKDFRKFSKAVGFNILKEAAIIIHNGQGKTVQIMPNLRANHGIFLIGK